MKLENCNWKKVESKSVFKKENEVESEYVIEIENKVESEDVIEIDKSGKSGCA